MPGERPLIDRLGVLPGMRVSLVGLKDPIVIDGIRARAKEVVLDSPAPGSDIVIFQVDCVADLAGVICVRGAMHSRTSIWVLWPRHDPDLRQSLIVAAGLACGLEHVKTIVVSDALSASRFVIPIGDRQLAPQAPEPQRVTRSARYPQRSEAAGAV